MKEILAYSNSARPSKAEVGQLFINVHTGETFVFKEDKWHPIEPVVPQAAQVLTTEKTPSTPKEELSEPPVPKEEVVLNTESQAAPAKAAAPKKKTSTKKKTTKKVEK